VAPDDAEALAAGGGQAPGTYDKVNEGSSYIENEAGRVDVVRGQAGFAPRGHARPQRLGQIPRFYAATRNEHRIVERREQLRKVLEKRRAERRDQPKRRLERERERRKAERRRR
jgi:hypothetical protein